ncbi:hypothetical protein FB446DRAFT_701300 [Lentinula raphanica]|nr:hypothetical protein FB446DRAFT_701300 [Lentinula raphanica]
MVVAPLQKFLLLYILLPILGVIINGHPIPPHEGRQLEKHPVELPYTVWYRKFDKNAPINDQQTAEWKPLFVAREQKFDWSILQTDWQELAFVIGEGERCYGTYMVQNDHSDPETNTRWPWQAEHFISPDCHKFGKNLESIGRLGYIQLAPTTEPDEVIKALEDVDSIQFQGWVDYVVAVKAHLLAAPKERFSLHDLDAGKEFDAAIHSIRKREKTEWREVYKSLVLDLYFDHAEPEDKTRWKLHRLFNKNCRNYQQVHGNSVSPPPLHFLRSYGLEYCVGFPEQTPTPRPPAPARCGIPKVLRFYVNANSNSVYVLRLWVWK